MSSTVNKRYVKKDLNTIQAIFELLHLFDFLISELMVLRAILNFAEAIVRGKSILYINWGLNHVHFDGALTSYLSAVALLNTLPLLSDGYNLCLLGNL